MPFCLRAVICWVALVSAASISVANDENKIQHIVMLIAEREYRTDETLPEFAKKHLGDFRVTTVLADPDDRNAFVGIEAIKSADLLLISVRRRTLPGSQLAVVRNYVKAGKPVIGIRTASHAFSLRGKDAPQGRAVWPEFDHDVFGGNYTNHHGNSLRTTIELVDKSPRTDSQVTRGISSLLPTESGGSLYRVSPLAKSAEVCLMGRVEAADPEPVAWTFRRKDGGKSFYTSLGHIDDFRGDVLPRLLKNAVEWALTP